MRLRYGQSLDLACESFLGGGRLLDAEGGKC